MSDGEIIVFYLRKKIDHQPLPPNKIIEVNLYAYDPDELAGFLFPYSSSTASLYIVSTLALLIVMIL